MFGSKRCWKCGRKLKDEWKFCPYCGADQRRKPYDIFENVEEEFKRIDKMFGPRFFKFPLDFEAPFKSGGISITIRSGTGMEPKIDVKTSGEYKKLEPEIKRKLGVKEGIREEETEKTHPTPKITEEPETRVERVGNERTITIKLPGVKSSEDVEVRKLEQSIEVKAFAGDKAYFKLIPIKPHAEIIDENFIDETLKIRVRE